MLVSHPAVAGVLESGILAPDIGLGGILQGEHWPREPLLETQREFFGSPVRLNQLVTKEEAVDDVRALVSSWLARALGPEHRYLVEKTPQHVHALGAIAEVFPDATLVHVIRDGRDVTASKDAAAGKWPGLRFGKPDPEQHARMWANTILGARAQAEEYGLRYLEVRFEELHQDPLAGARRLFDFCRIEASDAEVGAAVRSTEFATLAKQSSAFRRKGEVGDWRNRLGLLDRRRFHRGAGGLLHELGYESKRLWWVRPSRQPPR
jgi:hypothetical protein